MASKTIAFLALFLIVNLVLFNLTAATYGTCPRDSLKIGACANVLNLVNLNLGSSTALQPCCSLIYGLVDLEAALCLCTALKLSVLGIDLNLPIDLILALNACGRTVPSGFRCP